MHEPSRRSLRRAYLDWIEEQVESFKESIPRSELMRIAEEAVEELRVNGMGQYQLTEMLLLEAVDRKIVQSLGLPAFRAWSAAQESAAAEEVCPGSDDASN